MIFVENPYANVVKVTLPNSLNATNLRQLAPKIEALIKRHQTIRVMIDARGFKNWLSVYEVRYHYGSARQHQYHVDYIAVVAKRFWQRAFINSLKIFVKPNIQVFTSEEEALEFLSLIT